MVNFDVAVTAAVLSIVLIVVVLLYRGFSRSMSGVPRVFHAAAAISVAVGTLTAISGLGHSLAVGYLALRDPDYGPLTVLRFTTGAMLIYSGTISIAMYRDIRAGRHWAVAVSAASGLLFCVYLLFLLPLPGTGGTVPPMLAVWGVYLAWLGAAAFACTPANAALTALR